MCDEISVEMQQVRNTYAKTLGDCLKCLAWSHVILVRESVLCPHLPCSEGEKIGERARKGEREGGREGGRERGREGNCQCEAL